MHQERNKEERVPGDVLTFEEGGYSGAQFTKGLVAGIVRKTAPGIEASGRMQQEFSQNDYFQTPNVKSIGEGFFEMEHIEGAVSAARFVPNCLPRMQESVYTGYCNFILSNCANQQYFPKRLFFKKILQIIAKLKTVEDVRLSERVAYLINGDFKLVNGYCHGDFTLCNILYTKKIDRPYLIDFTPAYVQSPIMDVVKLMQEYKLGWSGRVMKLGEEYKRSMEVLKRVVEASIFFDINNPAHIAVEALNLLRILPYSKSKDMTKLLHTEINKLL